MADTFQPLPDYNSLTQDERRLWMWWVLGDLNRKVYQLHEDLHGNGKQGLIAKFNGWRVGMKVAIGLLTVEAAIGSIIVAWQHFT